MKYITENDDLIAWDEPNFSHNWILEYSIEKEDYFLNWWMVWQEMSGDFYKVEIAGNIVSIPSGLYVLIGDMDGTLDWIVIDEAIGRDVELVTLNNALTRWNLNPMKVIGGEEKSVNYPKTRNILPMSIGGDSLIFVSDKDRSQVMKREIINSLLIA